MISRRQQGGISRISSSRRRGSGRLIWRRGRWRREQIVEEQWRVGEGGLIGVVAAPVDEGSA